MGAYKKLNKQDVYVTSYEANKSYRIAGETQFEDYDVDGFYTTSGSAEYFKSPFDITTGNSGMQFNRILGYRGLNHLYYSNFTLESEDTGEKVQSGSFENYLMSSIATGSYKTAFRELPDNGNVFSIPRKHIGVGIKPHTFVMHVSGAVAFDGYSGSFFEGADGSYVVDGSDGISDSADDYVGSPIPEEFLRTGEGIEYIDDGEGNIVVSASNALSATGSFKVGDIIYPHGIVTITTGSLLTFAQTELDMRWKATQPIYTYNVRCEVKDHEMNFSQHPSAITGSEGILHNNVTGSTFQPYITTVGLYNDANELLAVSKFSQPIPKSDSTEMTFVVKLDM